MERIQCYDSVVDFRHLKVFLAVYKHRSFSRASRDLSLTQPTVSDHIQTLEKELKFRLFDRLGKMILPTKEGEILYAHAAEVVEKAEALKEILGQFRQEIRGELILGASNIPGTYLLPSLLTSFYRRFPFVTFQVRISDSRDILDQVIRHDLRIGIVGQEPQDPLLRPVPLMEDELIIVASPTLIRKPVQSLGEIFQHPLILREEGSGTLRETERILERKGISFRAFKVAGVFSSTEAVKQAVKAGLGISILSRISVIEDLACKTLKEIRVKDLNMKRQFFIVTHKRRSLPPTYQAFLDFLAAGSGTPASPVHPVK